MADVHANFRELLNATCEALGAADQRKPLDIRVELVRKVNERITKEMESEKFYTQDRLDEMGRMLRRCLKGGIPVKFIRFVLHPDKVPSNQQKFFEHIFKFIHQDDKGMAIVSDRVPYDYDFEGWDEFWATDLTQKYEEHSRRAKEELEARLKAMEAQWWEEHVMKKDHVYQEHMFPKIIEEVNEIVANVVDVPSAQKAFRAVNALTSRHSDILQLMWHSWLLQLQDKLICIPSETLSNIVYSLDVPPANRVFIRALCEENRVKQRMRPLPPRFLMTSPTELDVPVRERLYPKSIQSMNSVHYKAGNLARVQSFIALYDRVKSMPWSPERDSIIIEAINQMNESRADWAWLWNAIHGLLEMPRGEDLEKQQYWDELGGRTRRSYKRSSQRSARRSARRSTRRSLRRTYKRTSRRSNTRRKLSRRR